MYCTVKELGYLVVWGVEGRGGGGLVQTGFSKPWSQTIILANLIKNSVKKAFITLTGHAFIFLE